MTKKSAAKIAKATPGGATEEALDIDDPARLIDIRWGFAISEWHAGRADPLASEIKGNDQPIPKFARQFLADVVTGQVKRRRGRPPRADSLERKLVDQVYAEWSRSGPRDDAISRVAERNELEEDQLRGIFEKLQKIGYTRQIWAQQGRSLVQTRKID